VRPRLTIDGQERAFAVLHPVPLQACDGVLAIGLQHQELASLVPQVRCTFGRQHGLSYADLVIASAKWGRLTLAIEADTEDICGDDHGLIEWIRRVSNT
jgi:hypothetical protein